VVPRFCENYINEANFISKDGGFAGTSVGVRSTHTALPRKDTGEERNEMQKQTHFAANMIPSKKQKQTHL